MQNSAKEVIRAAIFSAVIEAVSAFREQSKGVANVMIRDLAAVHDNTAFSDLPDAVQTAIRTSTDEALRRLHKDGFADRKSVV